MSAISDIVDDVCGGLGWTKFVHVKAGETGGETVYDLVPEMQFDMQGGGTLSYAELVEMAEADHTLDLRCSASFFEGPAAKTRSRCRIHSDEGKLIVFDFDSEDTHRVDASDAVKTIADRLKNLPKPDASAPTAAPPVKQRARESTFLNAADLMTRHFDPIKYVVPGYIAEGLTLFAGAPKLGKSWLVLLWALLVASGGEWGGVRCLQGIVLYLALEDNLRRLQDRLRKLGLPVPADLFFTTEWERSTAGVKAIRQWIAEHPDTKLIIVDVLAMFRPLKRDRDQQQYEADYAVVKELQAVALETGVAIVVVHHTKKGGGSDAYETISGTLGLNGAADTLMVLIRDQNGCVLSVKGRDVQELDVAVEFDPANCRWSVLGDATNVRRSKGRADILQFLTSSPRTRQCERYFGRLRHAAQQRRCSACPHGQGR